jgi:predicted Rossmann-fold nucleotide-binding protein
MPTDTGRWRSRTNPCADLGSIDGGRVRTSVTGTSRESGKKLDLFSPGRQPNRWLTKEQRVSDFFPRLKRLTNADGFVVLQGGTGTLTEATLTWTLLQTGQVPSRPFIFFGESWRRLFETFRTETLMSEQEFALAWVVDSVEEALALLEETLNPSP